MALLTATHWSAVAIVLPTLRDRDQEGRAGSSAPGTAQVLVSGLPEIALRATRQAGSPRSIAAGGALIGGVCGAWSASGADV